MELKDFLPYLSVILSVITFFIGRQSASKTDGKTEGTILTKLDVMQSTITEVKTSITNYGQQITSLDHRLVGVERDMKTAYTRIDELRNDIKNLNNEK